MRRLVLLAVLLTGCDMYFSDGDDEPPCNYDVAGTKEGDLAPAQLLRDPSTGECVGWGNTGNCDDRCGPCPQADQAMPDWGSCYSECEAKSETECFAAAGCYAAYTDFPNQDRAAEFRGCWQTAPSGPISTGSCTALDAQECSRHDNCTMHYATGKFLACAAEITTTPPACSTLPDEAACAARSDCERIYKGEDCTCTPTSCDCKVLTYQRCEAR